MCLLRLGHKWWYLRMFIHPPQAPCGEEAQRDQPQQGTPWRGLLGEDLRSLISIGYQILNKPALRWLHSPTFTLASWGLNIVEEKQVVPTCPVRIANLLKPWKIVIFENTLWFFYTALDNCISYREYHTNISITYCIHAYRNLLKFWLYITNKCKIFYVKYFWKYYEYFDMTEGNFKIFFLLQRLSWNFSNHGEEIHLLKCMLSTFSRNGTNCVPFFHFLK